MTKNTIAVFLENVNGNVLSNTNQTVIGVSELGACKLVINSVNGEFLSDQILQVKELAVSKFAIPQMKVTILID